jgi:segregation and condensation protein B
MLRHSPGLRPGNRTAPLIHRLTFLPADGESATGDLAREPRLATLEAVLFAAEEPLSARRLAGIVGLKDAGEATRLVSRLQELYERGEGAFQVAELAGGFQLYTRPEFHKWLVRLRRGIGEFRLSTAARETLAIVAYRQPIMRAEIEAIRGVKSDEILHQLLDKGLLRIAGRDDSLGRPVVYATTKKFLQIFGLKSLADLPQAELLRSPAKRNTGNDSTPGDAPPPGAS